MHKSLSVGSNRLVICVWAAGLTLLLVVTGGIVWASVFLGAAFGIAAGVLQRAALRAQASAFAHSVTALDVRRVMTSSRPGKLALSLGWVCGLVLLPLAMLFQQGALVAASWFAGYLAFMFLRDLIALTALRLVVSASSPSV